MQTIMAITETNFLYSISDIRKRAFAFLQREMAAIEVHDIPPSYGDILYAVKKNGGVCLKDLCDLTNKDKSTVSLVVNALEKAGYVTKTKAARDTRSLEIRLTEKADRIAEDMVGISRKMNQKLFTGMSAEEKAILLLLLNKVAANM